MEQNIQCLLLKNNQVIIAEVSEVMADIGSPDCKLENPYLLNRSSGEISDWLEFTNQNEVMLRSDDILTVVCLLYTSPSPRDKRQSRMPSSA